MVSAHRRGTPRGIAKILADFLAEREEAHRYANGGGVGDDAPLDLSLEQPDLESRFGVGDLRLQGASLGTSRSPADGLRVGGPPRSPADHLSLGVPQLDPDHNAGLRKLQRGLTGAGDVLDRAGAMGTAAFAGAPRGAEYSPYVLSPGAFGARGGRVARGLAAALATRRGRGSR